MARGDPLRPGDDRRVRLVAVRGGDPDVHPGGGAAEQVGVRHVVGAVAEVGEGAARRAGPSCSATVCRSARIWQGWNSSVSALIDRDGRSPRASSSMPLLAGGAPDDRGDLPGRAPGRCRRSSRRGRCASWSVSMTSG